MKVAVSEDTNIKGLPKETTEVHLVRPLKKDKLDALLKKNISTITISQSCHNRLPKKAREKIKSNGTELIVENKMGRALDINLQQMLEIIELRKDYQSVREIEKITKVPKSTIHYLLKYAERGKIKKGKNIIYLK